MFKVEVEDRVLVTFRFKALSLDDNRYFRVLEALRGIPGLRSTTAHYGKVILSCPNPVQTLTHEWIEGRRQQIENRLEPILGESAD